MKHKSFRIILTDSVHFSHPIFVGTHLRKSFHSKTLLRTAFMHFYLASYSRPVSVGTHLRKSFLSKTLFRTVFKHSYLASYSRPVISVSFINNLQLICYYPRIPVY